MISVFYLNEFLENRRLHRDRFFLMAQAFIPPPTSALRSSRTIKNIFLSFSPHKIS